MFERYTEQARRSIFFAHFEANELGSPEIDTEHLLLGLLREVDLLKKTLSWAAAEQIRQEIKGAKPPGAEKISRSVDMPLTDGAKRALSFAAEEAAQLHDPSIEGWHLVLGLLRVDKCRAAKILKKHGVGLKAWRVIVATKNPQPTRMPEPVPRPDAPFIAQMEALLEMAAPRFGHWADSEAERRLKRKHLTRKEALGHLVDWAAAHQQWFASALVESTLVARGYPAEEWVAAQKYNEYLWLELVELWVRLNRLLVHVMERIPPEKLSMECRIGVTSPITLATLASNYVEHCDDITGQILTHG